MPAFIDLTGQRFGRWTILGRAPNRGAVTTWYALCDCGILKQVTTGGLRNGMTQSCGCLRNDTNKARPIAKGTAEERFWRNVKRDRPEICWLWTANTNEFGYGLFYHAQTLGQSVLAHRYSYTLHIGDIPDGLCVLHRCDNPPCVNPAHLFIGTRADNMADAKAKGRTVESPLATVNRNKARCIHGHDFDEKNTHWGKDGSRVCRTCIRLRMRARRAKSHLQSTAPQ